jgi:hypothetical protein
MEIIQVTKQMADDLVSLLKKTLDELSEEQRKYVHIYDNKKNALVISYDRDWYPFIGYTWGYNHSPTYLERIPQLLKKIGVIYMQENRVPSGGRVFIDMNCAFYVDDSRKMQFLCTLRWPNGRNIPGEVKN